MVTIIVIIIMVIITTDEEKNAVKHLQKSERLHATQSNSQETLKKRGNDDSMIAMI